jgi:Flp pilus assembly CpaF family ATPase
MTKQEYLLAVIHAMPDREMGRGIKAMIENNQLEQHTINKLVIVFTKIIDKISDAAKKQRIIEQITRFNEQKKAQAQQDAADLAKLDTMLNDF